MKAGDSRIMATAWMIVAMEAVSAAGPVVPMPAALPQSVGSLFVPDRRCDVAKASDELLVCGRARGTYSPRLQPFVPRFKDANETDGLFRHRLTSATTASGGGPKGSVGITLTLGF